MRIERSINPFAFLPFAVEFQNEVQRLVAFKLTVIMYMRAFADTPGTAKIVREVVAKIGALITLGDARYSICSVGNRIIPCKFPVKPTKIAKHSSNRSASPTTRRVSSKRGYLVILHFFNNLAAKRASVAYASAQRDIFFKTQGFMRPRAISAH